MFPILRNLKFIGKKIKKSTFLNTILDSTYKQDIKSLIETWNLSISQLEILYVYYNTHNKYPKCSICNIEHANMHRNHINNFCKKNSICSKQYVINSNKKYFLEKYGVENPYQSKEVKEKIKKNNIIKYGKEHYVQTTEFKEKAKQTCLKNYNTENPQRSKDIRNKSKQTCLKKYGFESYFITNEFKEKFKQTCLKKYNTTHTSKLNSVKEKSKQTCLKKYGFSNYMKNPVNAKKVSLKTKNTHFNKILKLFTLKTNKNNLTIINIIDQDKRIFNLKCNVCSNEFELKHNGQIRICCRKCNPYTQSKLESEIYSYLISNSLEVYSNTKKVIKNPNTNYFLELDLFIPKNNLAIEINGIYYHSIKDLDLIYSYKDYHLNKYLLCKEQSIKLIQFTDLDFLNKPNICYSIINLKLGINQSKIFARKCSIQVVSNQESKLFLQNNHIQGYTSSKINLGLYYNSELVQIMTFGHSRFNKKYSYELIRLCSKLNTSITGGSEKLFKHFVSNYLKEDQSIISYCDISKFSGLVYQKLGFKEIEQSKPNYFYWDNKLKILESRQKYQKHKLSSILKNFDPTLTEQANMLNNGYSIYYDCGNKVFVYK